MATTSVQDYVNKQAKNVTVNDDGSTVTVALTSLSSGLIDDSSVKRDWVITGTSNGAVSVIATGAGTDSIQLNAASDVKIDVGTGADSVALGTAATDTIKSVSITGGSGDKTIGVNGILDPSIISLQAGNHTITIAGGLLDSTIQTGTGRDTISIAAGATKGSTINSGAGDDSIVIVGDVNTTGIDMGAGRDTLNITGEVVDSTINGGDGVDLVSVTGGATNATISLGAGKDSLGFTAAIKDTSIYGGADADVVTLAGATYSKVDLGDGDDSIQLLAGTYGDVSIALGAGKDTIDATGITGTVSITDYDVLNDVIVDGGAILDKDASGNVTLTGGGVVNVSKTGEFYAVHTDTTGYVAWGDEDGSTINLTDWNKAATVDGNVNGDAGDLIIGGKKVDSVTLGANDSLYGGAGNDIINNAAPTATTQEFIGLASAGGNDSVTGFQKIVSGTADKTEADVLYLFENNISSLKLETSGTNIVAKVGNGSVQINGAATNGSRINVKDNSGTTYEVEYVDATDAITSATDDLADFYYASGTAAALNFSSVSDTLVVDLGNRGLNVNDTSLANTDNAFYYGNFATVTGGADKTVLLGAADAKESLIAGAGDTTLWGGGKKADYMEHTTTGNTAVFYFGDGDGADTINSSNWGNSETSDVLWLGTSSVKSVKNDGTSATTITLSDGSKATLSGFTATDTAIKVSFDGTTTMQAKVGKSGQSNSWTYEEGVTAYLGGSKNTLNVKNTVDEANIWLDGSQGKVYDSVTKVDASSNSGTVILAGGAANETLVAGTGNSSLWGGSAGNDVLTGNSVGNTTFYFGNGNGNDVISASNTDDKVVLYNTAISDVKAVDDSKSGVLKITLNDGSSLTVNNTSTSVNTFQLADGSTWKYDASNKSWSQG